MNNEELIKSTVMLTSNLRKGFLDSFLGMPSMNEQERFYITMQGLSALVSSIIDALIDNQYPDKKLQILEEFYAVSAELMKHKFKLEKEIDH